MTWAQLNWVVTNTDISFVKWPSWDIWRGGWGGKKAAHVGLCHYQMLFLNDPMQMSEVCKKTKTQPNKKIDRRKTCNDFRLIGGDGWGTNWRCEAQGEKEQNQNQHNTSLSLAFIFFWGVGGWHLISFLLWFHRDYFMPGLALFFFFPPRFSNFFFLYLLLLFPSPSLQINFVFNFIFIPKKNLSCERGSVLCVL